uniref:Uncharacterized protein n=1 Tax=viral metagenome TaxID=1070528 RepID=A0A6C0AP30_9ZZZZ
MNPSSVMLVFQRAEGLNDFVVYAKATKSGYTVKVIERDERDPYEQVLEVPTYKALTDYVDCLINQVTDDRDSDNPFTYLQYNIPMFPAILVTIDDLREDSVAYNNFVTAFDLYFS